MGEEEEEESSLRRSHGIQIIPRMTQMLRLANAIDIQTSVDIGAPPRNEK